MLNIPVYTLESPEVGEIQITVNDPNNPMWKGKYQTGKLAIYYADIIISELKMQVIPIIYIVSSQDIPELNIMGYQIYSKTLGLFELQCDLMKVIDEHYKEHLIEYKNQNEPVLH